MVFSAAGVLADLSPEEAVALLSALVFQEKSDVDPALPPALAAATEQLAAIAHEAGAVQAEAGLPVHPEEWARSVLKFGLVEVGSSSATYTCHRAMLLHASTLRRWHPSLADLTFPQ